MSSVIGRIRRFSIVEKAAAMTLIALTLTNVTVYDLMSVSFFSPMEKAADFRFSDFYALVANERTVRRLDPDIVLVPVDGLRRSEIARVLTDIDYCGAAVIGLDIVFSQPSDTVNDPLADVLSGCERLVMPVFAEQQPDGTYRISHESWYDSVVTPSCGFGAVNIQGDRNTQGTVREFRGSFPVSRSQAARSLPAAIAGVYAPTMLDRLEKRSGDDEAISFISCDFEKVSPDDILDNEDVIRDRIVFVGKLRDGADFHQTPIENMMPGMMIQAYTTATILSGDYTRRTTRSENLIMAALLCFITAWLSLRLSRTPLGALGLRLFQIGLLYLMILAGTWCYTRWNIDLNFAYAMLTTSLCVVAGDMFDGVFASGGLVERVEKLYCKLKEQYETIKLLLAATADYMRDADDLAPR